MDPQMLAQLLAQLSTQGDQMGLLGQQQQQNAAFMAPQAGQHTTGAGAALGGLGDIIRSGVGAYRQGKLNDQQQALLGQQGNARGSYMQALIGALRGQQGGPVDMNAIPGDKAANEALMNGGPPGPFGGWVPPKI